MHKLIWSHLYSFFLQIAICDTNKPWLRSLRPGRRHWRPSAEALVLYPGNKAINGPIDNELINLFVTSPQNRAFDSIQLPAPRHCDPSPYAPLNKIESSTV
jgi:hypothetical protein